MAILPAFWQSALPVTADSGRRHRNSPARDAVNITYLINFQVGKYILLPVKMWRAHHSLSLPGVNRFPIVLFPVSFCYPSVFAPSIQMCLQAPPCLSVRPSILLSIRTLWKTAERISIHLLLTSETEICQHTNISIKTGIKQHNVNTFFMFHWPRILV
jgi:hypothetical protein